MSLRVEHLSPPSSPLATFDARWKLAALLLAGASMAVMRSPVVLAAALATSLLLAAVARVPARWFWTRLTALLLALLPFLVVLPLTVDRDGASFVLAGIRLSERGFAAAAALTCKCAGILLLMLVALATTSPTVTLCAARRLHVPSMLVLLTTLSYRYVFLLRDELNRLRIALRVRGFRNRADRHSYRTIGRTTGTMLVRGAERAERVAEAMRCRGFDGNFRSLHEFRMAPRDVGIFLLIAATFAGLLAADFCQ